MPRVDTLFIDYLGAEDNDYVRAVCRKIMCATYMRVYHPGIKFDYLPVFSGAQGIGKSTFISNLGMEWFSDSLTLSDMNDKTAAEKLQGYWIHEIGELAGMKKADLDKVKAFVSRCDDKYRASFGRRVTPHPRVKWNNRGCRSTVWRCVSRVVKGGPTCPARTIREEDLHAAVVTAVNDIWSNRKCVIQAVQDNILAVIDNDTDVAVKDIDGRIQEKQQELLDAGQDQKKIDAIGDEILRLREERQATLTEAARKKGIQERLQDLAAFLEAQPAATTEYSDILVRRLIDTITVYDEKLVIEFKAGLKTEVEI